MTRQEILAVAKPILFNTEMVRAILDGCKTATRRVIKPQPCDRNGTIRFERWFHRDHYTALARFGDDTSAALCDRKSPYQIGNILYVRETWCRWWLPHGEWKYRYKATDPNGNTAPTGPEYDDELAVTPWRPSIHMPREATRIFLRVTEVRVERLQDITDKQIENEGIRAWGKDGKLYKYAPADREGDAPAWLWTECPRTPRYAAKRLWDSTIKPADLPIYGWDANPWVFVIEFERIFLNEAVQQMP